MIIKYSQGVFKFWLANSYSCSGQQQIPKKNILMTYDFLKQEIHKEPFFILKNHKEIINRLEDMILSQRWKEIKQISKLVTVNDFGSWLSLRILSKAFTKKANRIQFERENLENNFEMLDCMRHFRFEPRLEDESSIISKTHEFDNCLSFYKKLKDYFIELEENEETEVIYKYSSYLLGCNEDLFKKYRPLLEKHILELLSSSSKINKFEVSEAVVNGIYSNFWTTQFVNRVYKLSKIRNFNKIFEYVQFWDENNFKTKIVVDDSFTNANETKTESQISNIISGYDYVFEKHLMINNLEVDFLINRNIVLQYNGFYHYAINSLNYSPTIKEKWKINQLQRRGFIVAVIPYYQWYILKTFEKQREYVISKIENAVIDHIAAARKLT